MAHVNDENLSSLVSTREIATTGHGSSLDPRVEEVSWIAFTATAARAAAISSSSHLTESLRAMSDVLERTWDPGRTAAISRIACARDQQGRPSIHLAVAVGVLGAQGETEADARACAEVVEVSLARFPSPFTIEPILPARLLDVAPPQHLAAIRQRWLEAGDETSSVRAVSRFDRQIESSLELADLLLASPAPVMLQTAFLATALSPGDAIWLERESVRAEELFTRATEGQNPVVARRARRMLETLVDLSESFSGPLWVGEVLVGSDAPLPRPLLRSLAACITNELDVIHANQGSPIVADRRRIVGGYEIEHLPPDTVETFPPTETSLAFSLGLPTPALREPTLRDCFSLTEAALCFRWPIPAGRAIPTLPSRGANAIPAPAGLPSGGLRLGRDCNGADVFLGTDGIRTHSWALGATGAGKSTFIRACARWDLEIGRPFVLIDPHGDLTRAIRADAAQLGCEIALIDADEPATLALDLLDGLPIDALADAELRARAVTRLIDAITSHLPADWAGPRFRQIGRAALEVMIAASDRFTIRLADVGKLLLDRGYLEFLLSETDEPHAEQILRQHLKENDSAGVGLWAGSKFEDIAFNPGAQKILAPFGEGLAVGDALATGLPLVVNLSAGRLSRLASGLLGHIVLASAIDHALSRDPQNRKPFALYVDEAHRFPSANLIDGLAETRKYGCSLVAAHQEISQLDPEFRDGLLANAATRVIFRTGIADAHVLAPLTGIPATDLAGLPDLHAFVQIAGHAPFSVEFDRPSETPELASYEPPLSLTHDRETDMPAPWETDSEEVVADHDGDLVEIGQIALDIVSSRPTINMVTEAGDLVDPA